MTSDPPHTHLKPAIIVGFLQLPVDERALRLGAALQEHAAVLHAVHAPVLHAAYAVTFFCSTQIHKTIDQILMAHIFIE